MVASRSTRNRAILGAGAACLAALTSFGQPTQAREASLQLAAGPRVRASIVGDVKQFVPGTPFTVAIVFEIEPRWHTYYKDPGESGMPPEVRWTLPDGLVAGELQFPKPEVLKTPAGVNFVYHDKVAMLVEMRPGADFKIGRAVEIKGDVSWLECDADACVPGKQTVALSVTADERAAPVNQEQFAAWRAAVKQGESFDPAAAKK